MKVLTVDARLRCDHKTGNVKIEASQGLVTVEGRPILVYSDPEGKSIPDCSHSVPAAGILPCKLTLKARTGYSQFVRVGDRRICLDTVIGYTNGTPPSQVDYTVDDPGQGLVSEV